MFVAISTDQRVVKMVLSTWLKAAAATICTIGLVFQINEVSLQYFAYQTQSRVVAVPHYKIRVPSLSTCFRIYDIINFDRVKEEFGIEIFDSNGTRNWTAIGILKQTVPVKYLFRMTPNVTQIIRRKNYGCLIRFPDEDNIETFNLDQCLEHFNLSKYFHREHICYKFSPRFEKHKLRAKHYSLSDQAQGLIYAVGLNSDMFLNLSAITVYMHDQDSSPLFDAIYTQYIITDSYSEITPTFNTISVQLLEPPYDTNCQKYPDKESKLSVNLRTIQREVLKSANKLTVSLMLQEEDIPENVTLLTSEEKNQNKTLAKLYRKIFAEHATKGRSTCSNRCLISRLSFGKMNHFVFRVSWPDGLDIHVENVKKLAVIDFIVYICSCIGIWFGISFFSCFHSLKNVFFKRTETEENAFRTEVKKNQVINDHRYQELRKMLDRMKRAKK